MRKKELQEKYQKHVSTIVKQSQSFFYMAVFPYFNEPYSITCGIRIFGPREYSIPLFFDEVASRIRFEHAPENFKKDFLESKTLKVFDIFYTPVAGSTHFLSVPKSIDVPPMLDEFGEPYDAKDVPEAFQQITQEAFSTFITQEDDDFNTFYKENNYLNIMRFSPKEFYTALARQIVLIENLHNILNREIFAENIYSEEIKPFNNNGVDHIIYLPAKLLDITSNLFKTEHKKELYKKKIRRIEKTLFDTREILERISEKYPSKGNVLTEPEIIKLNKEHYEYLLQEKDKKHKFSRSPLDRFITAHWESLSNYLIEKEVIKSCDHCKSLFDRQKSYSYIRKGKGTGYKDLVLKYHHPKDNSLVHETNVWDKEAKKSMTHCRPTCNR